MILDCPAGNLIPISWDFLPWISDCCQLHAVGQAFSVLAWNDVRNQLGQSRQEQIHGIYRSVSKSAIQLLPANVVGWIHAQKAHTLEGTQNILAKKCKATMASERNACVRRFSKEMLYHASSTNTLHAAILGMRSLDRRWMYQTLWSGAF